MHKDIKADNLLIDTAGKVKICDFAFAKLKMTSSSNSMTSHAVCGTRWPCVMLAICFTSPLSM